MYIKLLAFLVLMAASYCQDFYHHTTALKTIVRHETPKLEQHNLYTEAIIPELTHDVYSAQQNYGQASSSQSTQSQIARGHDRIQPDIPNNFFEPAKQQGQSISFGHEQILNQVPEFLFVPAQNPAPVHETIADDTPPYQALRVQPVQPFPQVRHQLIQTPTIRAHNGISHQQAPQYQNSHSVEYHIQHRR